ncbi:dephospho-CoA kinase [Fusobacterium polymorphum]|uniref:Dephospho-CoA kinase n=2 Tax=Fusobacterium nucleatum subsp. polymorphum TaxID=76857 RepID=A0A2C6B3X4_FUSNP|nr:dephospho-CoA kinase [Fusobacterium polymorphum]PIM76214.1 dephospho-CoA kinase [Fusobacterium polymorphum]
MGIMIIGLTGGIASGKSTVSKYLAEKGFKVYDADKIAKDISEKKSVQEEIILTFGDKILEENRNIDRKKLKEIVFEDKEKLKQLNAIIHPKVIDFYKELKEQNTDKIIIFDVPLLFESGIDKFCDKILVVISDYEIQLDRIVERDKIDRELAEKIIKSQLSNEERIKKADVVIENNSSLEDLFEKVERFCETI